MDRQELGVKVAVLFSFVAAAGILLIIAWLPIVHESSHALVCISGGYKTSISFDIVQHSNKCYYAAATQSFLFLYTIAPYLLDLIVILIFALSSSKKTLFNIIPYAAFLDLVMNFLVQPLGSNNDFVLIAMQMPLAYYWLATLIFPAALLLFYLYHKKVKDPWKPKILENLVLKLAKK